MGVQIDYESRPSKAVTRQIFVALLNHLRAMSDLATYRYVGFGSYQFVDFELVHRQLPLLREMISVESNNKLIDRCKFNKPYKNIKLIPGTFGTVMPGLEWGDPAIVWLDYTQRLRSLELADCESVALRLRPGSVLALTFNCHPGDGDRRQELEEAVGAENVPIGTTDARLGDWGLARIQRELATSTIRRALADRGDGSSWHQLLNINYKDVARMQLIAGIVSHPDLHQRIEGCGFGNMAEVSMDAEALEIEIPILTVRERQALGQRLPARSLRSFAGIPQRDLDAYAKYYRWLDAVS